MWPTQLGDPAVALHLPGQRISRIRNNYLPCQQDGNEAWALGVNGCLRLVRVIGDGFLDDIEVGKVFDSRRLATLLGRWQSREQPTFNTTWTNNGETMRGTKGECGRRRTTTTAMKRNSRGARNPRVTAKHWYPNRAQLGKTDWLGCVFLRGWYIVDCKLRGSKSATEVYGTRKDDQPEKFRKRQHQNRTTEIQMRGRLAKSCRLVTW